MRMQALEVVRPLVALFDEETIPSEARDERIPSERDAHVTMRIKVNRFEGQNAPPESNVHGDEE